MTDVGDDPLSQSFYRAYKPFRNSIQLLGLKESLETIWRYSSHLSGDLILPRSLHGLGPRGLPLDIKDYVHHWELAVLAREVLLNASIRGHKSLIDIKVLSPVINQIKDLSSFSAETADVRQLLLHLHRLAHQQFPVQRGIQVADLMRHKLIFEHPDMEQVFLRGIGLSPAVFQFLGFAVATLVKAAPKLVTSTDYTPFGISNEQRDKFFSRLIGSRTLLKERIEEMRRYGRSWAYTINPLESTPLVNLDPARPERVYCPIPGLVLRRVTSGVYYDLNRTKGFENSFGRAFEDYVGLVLRKSCTMPGRWQVHKPAPYRVKKQEHHGVDWILTDGTANLFIECKATRIKAEAVGAESHSDVQATVARLADMVVQNYRNISEALSGITDWPKNTLPTFSLITTLEDFITFGSAVAGPVREKVVEGLKAKGLSGQLVERIPYSLVSAAEFEGICSVLNEHTAFDLFSKKHEGEHADWLFSAFCLQPAYRDAWARAGRLHADAFNSFRQQVNEMSSDLVRANRAGDAEKEK
ncbi:hypothetical protein ACOTJN_28505 [Achromobacter xylosoxidans]